MKKNNPLVQVKNGALPIPEEVAKGLDIKDGDTYEMTTDNNLLIFKPHRENNKKLIDAFKVLNGCFMCKGVDVALYIDGVWTAGKPIHAIGDPKVLLNIEYLRDGYYIKRKIGRTPFGLVYVVIPSDYNLYSEIEPETVEFGIQMFINTIKNMYNN